MTMIGKNIGHVRADIPPSKHAVRCLADAPLPAREVNFTVRDKLLQFGLAILEQRPSPYKTHKPGTLIDYLVPTEAGRRAIRAEAERGRG